MVSAIVWKKKDSLVYSGAGAEIDSTAVIERTTPFLLEFYQQFYLSALHRHWPVQACCAWTDAAMCVGLCCCSHIIDSAEEICIRETVMATMLCLQSAHSVATVM